MFWPIHNYLPVIRRKSSPTIRHAAGMADVNRDRVGSLFMRILIPFDEELHTEEAKFGRSLGSDANSQAGDLASELIKGVRPRLRLPRRLLGSRAGRQVGIQGFATTFSDQKQPLSASLLKMRYPIAVGQHEKSLVRIPQACELWVINKDGWASR